MPLAPLAARLTRRPARWFGAVLALVAACGDPATSPLARPAPGAPAHLLVPATGYRDVSAASALYNGVACAVDAQGALVCWGDPSNGLTTPPSGRDFTQVAVGAATACARRADGTIACWGSPGNPPDGRAVPPAAGGYSAVTSGEGFSCALDGAGAITCWGYPGLNRTTPPSGTGYLQIDAGRDFGCAVAGDHHLACWGSAQGTDGVPGGTNYVQVSAGSAHACALTSGGTLACWGANGHGALDAPAFTDYTAVSAGADFTCALHGAGSAAGTLVCFGDGTRGETTPPAGAGYSHVSAGAGFACALDPAGAPVCWGFNSTGQLDVPPVRVAPAATLGAPATAVVGQSFTLTLTGAQVPGHPEATRFTYAFDCGTGAYGTASQTASASCTPASGASLRVRGKVVDQDGDSAEYSANVAVGRQAQAIQFTSTPPSPALVGGTYAVSATGGGSANPVTFTTTSAACTVSGSTVRFVAAGPCVIAADQAENAAYDAAPRVTQTVSVGRAAQAITFAPLPAAPKAGTSATLSATGGGSNQPVTFTSSTPATCRVSGSTVSFVSVGPCTVAADQLGSTAYDPAPTATRGTTVVSRYAFGGFAAPVDAPPTVNVVKAGQAVPLSFSLGGDYGLGVLAAGSPASRPVACDAGAPQDGLDAADAPGNSGLTYDARAGRYGWTWKTEKGWSGTCRELVLTLDDGSTHTARFRFR